LSKRSVSYIAVLASMLLLSGCWDRTEINDVAFVLSTALDLEKDGQVRLTVLIPLPGQMGGQGGGGGGTSGDKSYYLDSEVGPTYRDAHMKLQRRMSRRMFLAHRRTILVGEELARQGIRDVFDSSPRSPETRMSTYMIVTKGKAYEMLEASPRFERFPSESIRELAKDQTVADMNMKDVALGLSSQGGDPTAVYMDVSTSQKGDSPSKEIEIKGYALFSGDKMIGTLENETANGYSWLNNWKVINNITLPVDKDHLMTLRLYSTRTHITPSIVNGKLNYSIYAHSKARLLENKSFYDLSQTAKALKVEAAISAYVKQSIQAFIDKSIKTDTDPAQFGAYLWRAYPEKWNSSYRDQWPADMKQARFSIQAESELTDTGLIYENVTKERSS
jgi:spore germination protein KC